MSNETNQNNSNLTEGGVEMVRIVDKTIDQKRKREEEKRLLQAKYEEILANPQGGIEPCVIVDKDCKPNNNHTADVNNNVPQESSYIAPQMPPVSQSNQPVPYQANNIAQTIQKFDQEQKQFTPKEQKLTALNNSLSALSKPNKASQYMLAQKLLKLVPIITNQGKIFIYNGTYYELAKPDVVKQKIMEYLRNDLKDKQSSFVNGIYQFIKMEPTIAVASVQNNNLMTFNNLILDLDTGNTYDLSPRFITSYQVKANLLPGYNLPMSNFSKFLDQITGGDKVLAQRILEIIFICISPLSLKYLYLFQGYGSTGKSLLTRLMQNLISTESVYPMKAENLRKPFAMGELYNRVLAICNEFSAAPITETTTATIKEITGNDLLSSHVKYGDDIIFTNFSKLLIVTNHALVTKEPDEPFYKRIVCVPFKYPVAPENIDVNLLDKLWAERDAIVNAAVNAFMQFKARNYIFSGNYEPNIAVVHDESSEPNVENLILNYLDTCYEVQDESFTFIDDAYNLFLKMAQIHVSLNVFSPYFKRLASEIYGAQECRKRKQPGANPQYCVKGVKIKQV